MGNAADLHSIELSIRLVPPPPSRVVSLDSPAGKKSPSGLMNTVAPAKLVTERVQPHPDTAPISQPVEYGDYSGAYDQFASMEPNVLKAHQLALQHVNSHQKKFSRTQLDDAY